MEREFTKEITISNLDYLNEEELKEKIRLLKVDLVTNMTPFISSLDACTINFLILSSVDWENFGMKYELKAKVTWIDWDKGIGEWKRN